MRKDVIEKNAGGEGNTQFDQSRRDFLRGLVRLALVASAVIGVGGLVAKRGETCTSNGICRGCSSLRDCGLPQALSLKKASTRKP